MGIFALRTNDGDIWPGDTVMLNGYLMEERLLEDTLWVLKVVNGQLTFSHVHEDSRIYVEGNFSEAKIAQWGEEAVKQMTEFDADGLAEDHETDLHWGDA